MKYLFYLIIVNVILFASCKNKTDYNSLRTISYKTEIEPIIMANCTASGCHGTVNKKEFTISDYESLIKECKVNSTTPSSTDLFNVITKTSGDEMMPPAKYSRLSDAQIQLITVWIGQGYKNN